jgi:hypothetical protein
MPNNFGQELWGRSSCIPYWRISKWPYQRRVERGRTNKSQCKPTSSQEARNFGVICLANPAPAYCVKIDSLGWHEINLLKTIMEEWATIKPIAYISYLVMICRSQPQKYKPSKISYTSCLSISPLVFVATESGVPVIHNTWNLTSVGEHRISL